MEPIEAAFMTIVLFFGGWASLAIGWYADEWTRKLFSYRVRTTDTHLILEKATKEEIDRKFEQKYDEEYFDYKKWNGVHRSLGSSEAKDNFIKKAFLDEFERQKDPRTEVAIMNAFGDIVVKYHEQEILYNTPEAVKSMDQEILDSLNEEQLQLLYTLLKAQERTPPYDHIDL